MLHALRPESPYIQVVSPGAGAAFNPSALARMLDADPDLALFETAGAAQAAVSADRRDRLGRVTAPAGPFAAAVTTLSSVAALERLSFVGATAPKVQLKRGFARITPHARSRAHGVWADAGDDGVYRALVRWSGADLPPSLERRFCFGVRLGCVAGVYSGARVDAFRTLAGAPRLQIREYAGAKAMSVSLATRAAPWSFDAWQWIDVEVVGPRIRARIYPEASVAPAWQISAVARRPFGAAFGPGGAPGQGLSPVIDVRRLEFHPAVVSPSTSRPQSNP